MSNEIWFNLQRFYNDQFEWGGNLLAQVKTLAGIVDIKPTSKLTGNQVLSMPLQQRFITPLVGRGLGTIQRPRLQWNSAYEWEKRVSNRLDG